MVLISYYLTDDLPNFNRDQTLKIHELGPTNRILELVTSEQSNKQKKPTKIHANAFILYSSSIECNYISKDKWLYSGIIILDFVICFNFLYGASVGSDFWYF